MSSVPAIHSLFYIKKTCISTLKVVTKKYKTLLLSPSWSRVLLLRFAGGLGQIFTEPNIAWFTYYYDLHLDPLRNIQFHDNLHKKGIEGTSRRQYKP